MYHQQHSALPPSESILNASTLVMHPVIFLYSSAKKGNPGITVIFILQMKELRNRDEWISEGHKYSQVEREVNM